MKNRYAQNIMVSNRYYGTIQLSGQTLLSTKTSGLTSGYVWAPYIMVSNTSIIWNREYQRMKLLEDRKKT
jgi:hypothetical protein